MAITIEANYSKKLGLPNFSSHQYSITIRKEISDLSALDKVSSDLYALLQDSVDREIREPGFLGDAEPNGFSAKSRTLIKPQTSNSSANDWKCSIKQRDLILKVVDENRLPWNEAEALAKERFNTPVRTLNKLQASGFIDELLNKINKSKPVQERSHSTRTGK